MPSYPVPGPVRRMLPTPVVSKVIVRQPIDLKPMGNTVAVSTLADNPFEGPQHITVRTQASGGMARPDSRQVSRELMFVGDDVAAKPKEPSGTLDFLNTIVSGATNVFKSKYDSATSAAQARSAEAQSAARQSADRTTALLAQLSRPGEAMARHKSISIPLLVLGGGALLVAGYLFLKKRKAA